MKKLLIIVGLYTAAAANAQNSPDSLQNDLSLHTADTARVYTLLRIGVFYFYSQRDSAIKYVQNALQLAEKAKFLKGQAQAFNILANIYTETGNHIKAMELHHKVLAIQEKRKDPIAIATTYNNLARVYQDQGDYTN